MRAIICRHAQGRMLLHMRPVRMPHACIRRMRAYVACVHTSHACIRLRCRMCAYVFADVCAHPTYEHTCMQTHVHAYIPAYEHTCMHASQHMNTHASHPHTQTHEQGACLRAAIHELLHVYACISFTPLDPPPTPPLPLSTAFVVLQGEDGDRGFNRPGSA